MDKQKIRTKIFQASILLALWMILIVRFQARWLDDDTWFILALGREICENGIPHTNPFFLGQTVYTLVPQWLYDVLLYQIQAHFGIYGILPLIYLGMALGVFFMYRLSRIFKVDKYVALLLITVYWYMNLGAVTARPNLWSVVLCVIQIYCLELYIAKDKIAYLLPIPVIALLEVNLHCSMWAMHLCVMAAYVCPAIRMPFATEKRTYRMKPLIYTTVFCFIAGLANPYGIDAMLFLRGSITEETTLVISEMRPSELLSGETFAMVIAAFCLIVAIFRKPTQHQHIYLFAGWLFLGCQFSRNYIWGYLSIMILAFVMLKETSFEKYYRTAAPKTWPGLLPILLIFVLIIFLRPSFRAADEDDLNTPYSVVNYIREHSPECDAIFTEPNMGDFLEWQGFKTYMDTRADAFLPAYTGGPDLFHEYYLAAYAGDYLTVKRIIEKYDFEYAYVYDYSRIQMYMEMSPEYERVLQIKCKRRNDGVMVQPDENTVTGILYRRVSVD